ncbi:hypothetical protein PAXRUDRAFT_163109 [Paxillus rubicundulus Ve08.2h10]|uniref:CCHC-type domain-containing protein n=1 Tax=Paxillus rubicundulus Ve08.2h10 TaxID=930991 RepID=A0A0D0CTL2_9AGAM|nr:hypothetical protein PAXRUDRAFT_163109 [Paxillus rubicundulus Ve08.2h10]
MDVDAVRLTPLQRAEYMKKGLCFVCGKQGHRSTDHKSAVEVPSIPTLTPSAIDVYFSELRKQNIPEYEVLDVLRTCFEDKNLSDENTVSVSKVKLFDQDS